MIRLSYKFLGVKVDFCGILCHLYCERYLLWKNILMSLFNSDKSKD